MAGAASGEHSMVVLPPLVENWLGCSGYFEKVGANAEAKAMNYIVNDPTVII